MAWQFFPDCLHYAGRGPEPRRKGTPVPRLLRVKESYHSFKCCTTCLIRGITAVPDSQLAKEQAEVALTAAKEKGAAIASNMVAKFGLPTLIAEALLIVSWFFLTAVSVQISFAGKLDFTFWQVLGFLN